MLKLSFPRLWPCYLVLLWSGPFPTVRLCCCGLPRLRRHDACFTSLLNEKQLHVAKPVAGVRKSHPEIAYDYGASTSFLPKWRIF
ncbi:hypothetical protein F4776DRAFT_290765 [Hypoxylon sp. NC0597]|nr:hypothetical protein F4776DRAFT_290765 [Hypoxylon sp. NC0597]